MSSSGSESDSKSSSPNPKDRGKKRKGNDVSSVSSVEKPAPKKNKQKTVEEEYIKMDPREHVLLRPDMYIGSNKLTEQQLWIYDDDRNCMVSKTIKYSPGLYKIFDEILVNAADNFQRDSKQTTIKVDIDPKKNEISVYNDGTSVPVEIHSEHNKYVPELVFGELLTGSNFDDEEEKVTGGRNGLGAKLTNIYSTKFTVECADGPRNKKKLSQVFTKNMSERSEPVITTVSSHESYVRITFVPDLKRFSLDSISSDMLALLKKRVVDVAGCNSKLRVFLNNKEIQIKSFTDYIKLYLVDYPSLKSKIVYDTVLDSHKRKRWEIGITISDDQEAEHVSFVNSISTPLGGNHVKHVNEKLVEYLRPIIENKMKSKIEPKFITSNIWVFINCLISNPEFDSQTKERLKSNVSTFGTKCVFDEAALKKLQTIGLIDRIIEYSKNKSNLSLYKSVGGKKSKRVTGYEQLIDANFAGSKKSRDCTLILTEGISAKALAVAGMSVVGRDYYGVFPLRGKVLNVRKVTDKNKILANTEVQAIMQIVGLKPGTEYKKIDDLRYGHLMVMADQDVDGSHIKGLVVNLIHFFWPSLFQHNGFLTQFITPIIKATKGDSVTPFYSIPQYEEWCKAHNDGKGWKSKYYKGLGTSTAEEAREYFSQLVKHKKEFEYTGKSDDAALKLAFAENKTYADKRKEWINSYETGTFLDPKKTRVPYHEFINKELVLFSIEDCSRSIPSMVDGLKPSQRKILFSCIKRNLVKEIRVAQLSGYVSEKAAYHHGEASLQSTIVGMAQNFVGSNNINLLHPQGQFGTRLEGGKDAASARYIHTFLSGLSRAVFNPSDDNILTYLNDEGLSIEPEWYIPVIPLILVNGCYGIGTGYSTYIPNYNPRDIVHNIFRLLANKKPRKMVPWYRGYQGKIVPYKDKRAQGYMSTSNWKRKDDTTLEVTELPIGIWTVDFKSHLESLSGQTDAAKAKKNKEKVTKKRTTKKQQQPAKKPKKPKTHEDGVAFVKDYKDHNTDTRVHFIINVPRLSKMTDQEIESVFGLTQKLSISNFHLFDEKGKIQKYKTVDDILKMYFDLRYKCYQKRKDYMIDQLTKDWKKLQNKVRFVTEVVAEQLIVRNRKKKELTAELLKKGYDRFPPDQKKSKKGKKKDDEEDEDDDEDVEESTSTAQKKAAPKVSKDKVAMDNLDKDYDYLLSMKIWSLTAEYIELLKKKLAEKKEELDNLAARTPRDMWEEDLDFFMELWDVFEKDLNDFESHVGKSGKKKIKMPTMQANARLKAKQRALQRAKDREAGKEDMSGDESSESESVVEIKKDSKPTKKTGSKLPAPKNKSTDNYTKAALKKKDDIVTKNGKKKTLHDYFSMDTSNSASVSPKKSNLSKSEAGKKANPPPKRRRSKSEKESESSYYYSSYYTDSSEGKTSKNDKTEKTEKTDKTEKSANSKTEKSDSDSVFDSGDNAPSESEDDEVLEKVTKKPDPKKK